MKVQRSSEPYTGIQTLRRLEETMYPWLRAKANILLSLVEGERILEIGCGIGSITQFLCSKASVFACDKSETCVVQASTRRIPARFFVADICDKSYWRNQTGKFDTVVMSDVLEHVHDTDTALENIRLLLKSKGVLVLTVPAHRLLYSKVDREIGHLRRYAKKQLTLQLQRQAFDVEVCKYWNLPGFLGWLLAFRLMHRDFNYIRPGMLTRSHGYWLAFEAKGNLPTGLTLIAKCRRP